MFNVQSKNRHRCKWARVRTPFFLPCSVVLNSCERSKLLTHFVGKHLLRYCVTFVLIALSCINALFLSFAIKQKYSVHVVVPFGNTETVYMPCVCSSFR